MLFSTAECQMDMVLPEVYPYTARLHIQGNFVLEILFAVLIQWCGGQHGFLGFPETLSISKFLSIKLF